MPALANLFSPLQIGSLRLKNRIVMSPMALNYSGDAGSMTQRQLDYYAARARGGVGLIVSESFYVLPNGRGGRNRQGLSDDSMLPQHRMLTSTVHQYGTPIFAQLHHGGVTVPVHAIGQVPVGPSAIPFMSTGEPFVGTTPRQLTTEGIREVVDAFAKSARRAQEAGYDGIQIHAGHGYLINEFLSPHYNRREDSYGGSNAGRIRFLHEIIEKVRQTVGPSFPISLRLTGKETMADGYGPDFTHWVVRQVERWIDEVCISGGTYDDRQWIVPPMSIPEGFRVDEAASFKKFTNCVVSTVGRITSPRMADQIIAEDKADLIYMGRALLADPDLPNKASKGAFDEIRPCLGCNRCVNRIHTGTDVGCAVNPQTGHEGEADAPPPSREKKVLVVGGGPSGMQAAARAAARGHKVTLLESRDQLGGRLRVAATPPGRQSVLKIINYLEALIRRYGVEVETGVHVTAETVERLNPEALVLATGGAPIFPQLPGIAQRNVCHAEEVLNGNVNVAGSAVVIGGGMVGFQTADFLSDKGTSVTVLEMENVLAGNEDLMTKKLMLQRLGEKGVAMYLSCRVEYVTTDGVVASTIFGRQTFRAEKVVIATGYRAATELLNTVDLSGRECYIIGDAKLPAGLLEAIRDGFSIGNQI